MENTEDKKAKVEETIDDPNDMSLVDRILAGDAYASTQSHSGIGDKSIAALERKVFGKNKVP